MWMVQSPCPRGRGRHKGYDKLLDRNLNLSIILIGPIGAGKTTIGHLLADSMDLPFCSVDDVRSVYYQRVGYDESLASAIAASEQGVRSELRYAEPFDVQMIKILLAEFQQGIIDFGASNSVYNDKDLLSKVEHVLAPYPNVFLLLPSPDKKESAAILKIRLIRKLTESGQSYNDELFELNNYFIQNPSNYQLAKRIVYTKGKMPDVIRDEIFRGLVY